MKKCWWLMLVVVIVALGAVPVFAQGSSKVGFFAEAGYRHLSTDLKTEPIDDFSMSVSGYKVFLSGVSITPEAEVDEPVLMAGYRDTSANGWLVYGQFNLRDTEISGPIAGRWSGYGQSGSFSGKICIEAEDQPVVGIGVTKNFALGQTSGSMVVGGYYNHHFSKSLDGGLDLRVLGVAKPIPLQDMELSGYDYGARAGLGWMLDVGCVKVIPSAGVIYSKSVLTVEDETEETDFEQDGNISGFASIGLETARGLTFFLAGQFGGEQSVMAMAGYTF